MSARGLTVDPYAPRPDGDRRGDPGRPADPRASLGAARRHRPPARQGGAGDRRRASRPTGAGAAGPGPEVVGFDPLFVGESLDPRDPVAASARDRPLRDLQPVAGRRPDAGPGHRARLVPGAGRRARGQPDRRSDRPAPRCCWPARCSKGWRGPRSSSPACRRRRDGPRLAGDARPARPASSSAACGPPPRCRPRRRSGSTGNVEAVRAVLGPSRLRSRRRRADAATRRGDARARTRSRAGSIAARMRPDADDDTGPSLQPSILCAARAGRPAPAPCNARTSRPAGSASTRPGSRRTRPAPRPTIANPTSAGGGHHPGPQPVRVVPDAVAGQRPGHPDADEEVLADLPHARCPSARRTGRSRRRIPGRCRTTIPVDGLIDRVEQDGLHVGEQPEDDIHDVELRRAERVDLEVPGRQRRHEIEQHEQDDHHHGEQE